MQAKCCSTFEQNKTDRETERKRNVNGGGCCANAGAAGVMVACLITSGSSRCMALPASAGWRLPLPVADAVE
jgi:hypothetical protein